MSDASWDSSTDIEVPTADAVEQHQGMPGEPDETPETDGFELPNEADEADAAEQHFAVGSDEDDSYR